MARLVKCPFCGQQFNRDEVEYVHYKNRYWHKKCFNEKFPNEEEKEALRNYIKKIFHMEQLTVLINKQIKTFVEENHYTYSGIMGTLVYCYEIRHMDITKAKGIGIVPYNYDEARSYFAKQAEQQNRISEAAKIIKERKKENIKLKITAKNHIKKRRKML